MDIITRSAAVADISTIQRIAAVTWPHAYADVLTPKQVSYMLNSMYSTSSLTRQMETEGQIFLLTLVNNIPTGFAAFGEVEAGIWKLHKLYVLPFQQKSGIGKALLQQAEAYAISQGAHALILNVNRNNAATDFYKRQGFFIDSAGDFDIGKGFFMNDYIMKKMLG